MPGKILQHLHTEAAILYAGKLGHSTQRMLYLWGEPASAEHEGKAGQRIASLVQAGK
jgi:hypothetical protein